MAQRSVSFPSAGRSRPAYPDIHMPSDGVMQARATPAFQTAEPTPAASPAASSACQAHAMQTTPIDRIARIGSLLEQVASGP